MSALSTGHHDNPGRYEIRLKGHLDSRWAAWFDGLTLTRDSDGTTIIGGLVADQAALYGLLQKTRDLGLPLISVNHVEPGRPLCPPSRPGNSANREMETDMATTVQTPATKAAKGTPMTSTRKTALVAGIFYLITFVSIPTLVLYGPVKNHRDWILSSGGHTGLLVGCVLEVIVALAGIGTAVTLYPVVRRQHEGIALGFVAARVLEGAMIFTGVVSLLSLVSMRQSLGGAAGADADHGHRPVEAGAAADGEREDVGAEGLVADCLHGDIAPGVHPGIVADVGVDLVGEAVDGEAPVDGGRGRGRERHRGRRAHQDGTWNEDEQSLHVGLPGTAWARLSPEGIGARGSSP